MKKEDDMKRIFLVMILFGGLIFSAGCGATHYTIHMKSGEQHVAVGEPEYIKVSDTVKFKNVNGQKVEVQKQDIDKVVENLD